MIFLKLFIRYIDSAELFVHGLEKCPEEYPRFTYKKVHQPIRICSHCANINWSACFVAYSILGALYPWHDLIFTVTYNIESFAT